MVARVLSENHPRHLEDVADVGLFFLAKIFVRRGWLVRCHAAGLPPGGDVFLNPSPDGHVFHTWLHVLGVGVFGVEKNGVVGCGSGRVLDLVVVVPQIGCGLQNAGKA